MANRRRYRFRMNKQASMGRLIQKITTAIIMLWVGGSVVYEVGQVLVNEGTISPFLKGLTLIGFTVNSTGVVTAGPTGSGLLVVVGLVAIASVVMEFVRIEFY